MNFDFSSLDTKTPMEKAARMTVVDPKTQTPIILEDGQPLYIELLGSDSEAVRSQEHAIQDDRMEKNRRTGRGYLTSREVDAEQNEILVVATRGWNIPSLDGNPFPYSPENARRLWNDPRFQRVAQQARIFMGTLSNFVKA